VAAYIYVQNKISLPEASGEPPRTTLKDLLTETVFGTLLFDIIAGLLLLGFAILPATVYTDAVRTNLLLIALMGGAVLIVGALLYGMAARLRSYGRFLLPLPPPSSRTGSGMEAVTTSRGMVTTTRSVYLANYTDKDGDWLEGDKHYTLHVPANFSPLGKYRIKTTNHLVLC